MHYYELFLDESSVSSNNYPERYFTVAGVIIDKDKKRQIRRDMKSLKQQLWVDSSYVEDDITQFIFHELVVQSFNANKGNKRHLRNLIQKYGEQNLIFKNKNKVNELYDGLAQIFDRYDIPVMGVTIDLEYIEKAYHSNQRGRLYPIAIQLLIENFVQFLIKHDGFGSIIIESQSNAPTDKSDFITQSKFYDMKARGTMFIGDEAIQRHLGEIKFRSKDKSEYELQLADFVPNNFSRRAAGKDPRKLSRTLLNHRYDGMEKNPDRFGVKMIP
jgi:hypothetical protein